MTFHEKLREYFEERKITKRFVAEKIGYDEVMVGRYLRSSKPNYEFLRAVKKSFPYIDFNYLFEEEENSDNMANEGAPKYGNPEDIINKIDYHLKELRKVMAQKSHD